MICHFSVLLLAFTGLASTAAIPVTQGHNLEIYPAHPSKGNAPSESAVNKGPQSQQLQGRPLYYPELAESEVAPEEDIAGTHDATHQAGLSSGAQSTSHLEQAPNPDKKIIGLDAGIDTSRARMLNRPDGASRSGTEWSPFLADSNSYFASVDQGPGQTMKRAIVSTPPWLLALPFLSCLVAVSVCISTVIRGVRARH